LVALLPERAASQLSVQSLREDIEVSHDTVRRWLNYLKDLYYHYELKPYSRSIQRSLKKEPKLYLWDWSEINDEGRTFENLVANHLLKACHFWSDIGEGNFDLFYLRDKEKNEIDFLIIRDRKPWAMIEAKLSDRSVSDSFAKFSNYLQCPYHVQIIRSPGIREMVRSKKNPEVLLVSASDFLSFLP